MECLKDCCRNLMKRRKEQELQGRPLSVPPAAASERCLF